jgi:hypothetical protein
MGKHHKHESSSDEHSHKRAYDVLPVPVTAASFGAGVVTGAFISFTAPLTTALPNLCGKVPIIVSSFLVPTTVGASTVGQGPVFSLNVNSSTPGGSITVTIDAAAAASLGLTGLYTGTTLTASVSLFILV